MSDPQQMTNEDDDTPSEVDFSHGERCVSARGPLENFLHLNRRILNLRQNKVGQVFNLRADFPIGTASASSPASPFSSPLVPAQQGPS